MNEARVQGRLELLTENSLSLNFPLSSEARVCVVRVSGWPFLAPYFSLSFCGKCFSFVQRRGCDFCRGQWLKWKCSQSARRKALGSIRKNLWYAGKHSHSKRSSNSPQESQGFAKSALLTVSWSVWRWVWICEMDEEFVKHFMQEEQEAGGIT